MPRFTDKKGSEMSFYKPTFNKESKVYMVGFAACSEIMQNYGFEFFVVKEYFANPEYYQ